MALNIMYVVLLACWGIIIFGFHVKDFWLVAIPCFALVVWSLEVIINGLVGYQDWFTNAFAIINLFIALYIPIRGGWETYKDN